MAPMPMGATLSPTSRSDTALQRGTDKHRDSTHAPHSPARTLRILRILSIAAGLAESFTFRHYVFADDISYLEIARNYAAGHWSLALNSYWSPLLSWILAVPMKWPGISDYWELAALHAVVFLAYLTALLFFDRLTVRLGPRIVPVHCDDGLRTWYVAAYSVFLWAALYAVRMLFCAADMIVMAIVLGLALLTLDVVDGRATKRTWWLTGAALGLGYLAKTAMLPLAPVYLGVMVWNLRRRRESMARVVQCLVALMLVSAPFIVALRMNAGYWTLGETGRLNDAWEVCGAARWTHWQGEPGNIGTPVHPIRTLSSSPPAYEFNSPMPVSYSLWYNPSWWYAGVHPAVAIGNQLSALGRNGRYLLILLLMTPAVGAAAILAAWKRRWKWGFAWPAWAISLAVPVVAALFLYALVFVDRRYVGGQLAIMGMVIVAGAIPLFDSARLRQAMRMAAAGGAVAFTGLFLFGSVAWGLHDLVLSTTSDLTRHREYDRAMELRSLGLKPGDRVGYVGFSFAAYWALLDQVQIIADIPVENPRRVGFDNDAPDDYTAIDSFWHAPPADRQHMLDLMKQSGARAVVADMVPPGAPTEGWHRLHATMRWPNGRNDVYIRFLDATPAAPVTR